MNDRGKIKTKKGYCEVSGRIVTLFWYEEEQDYFSRRAIFNRKECVIGESLLYSRLISGDYTVYEAMTSERKIKARQSKYIEPDWNLLNECWR